MAEQQSGLNSLSQANFFGQPSEAQQGILDATQAAQDALEQRYANPNWFKVAAGFLKPQLGGFGASLGSASEARGDWTEKQRENQLPIAQYRAQVALMKNQMSQNQTVNDLVANHKGPITEDLVQQAVSRAPDAPATKGLQASLKTQNERLVLEQKNQELALSKLNATIASNQIPTDAQYFAAGVPIPGKSPSTTGGDANAKTNAPPSGPISVPSDSFLDATHNIENPGNLPKAQTPVAGAGRGSQGVSEKNTAPQQGPGQFTQGTLKDIAARYPNVGDPQDYGRPGKDDTTNAFDAALLADNHAKLTASGITQPTALDHRLAWHFGADKVQQLDAAPPTATLGSLFTKKDADGNLVPNTDLLKKNNLSENMTVQELKNIEAGKLRANGLNPTLPVQFGTLPTAEDNASFPAVVPSVASSELTGLSPEIRKQKLDAQQKRADAQETQSNANLSALAPYGSTAATELLNQAKAAENQINGNRYAAEQVHNILGADKNGKLMAQLLQTAQAGMQFNGGILQGSLSLPANKWKDAGLDPELTSYANDLVTHYLIMQSAKARLAGGNITQTPVAEFTALQNASANLHQPWDSALHSVRQDIVDTAYKQKMYNTFQQELGRVAPGELAPVTAVYTHSQKLKNLNDAWVQHSALINGNREKERNAPTGPQ